MTRRIALALTLHNHQPVGNFGWVIAETYEHAYLPMVEALERHPGVRVALHYTGPLLAWLRAERPEFVARLARPRRARPDRDRRRRLVRAGPRRPARARPGRPARPDGRRARGDVRPPAARRLARRARLGARPADRPRLGRLRLDGPRRRPLPGGRDPRGRPVGLLHDRRPGQGPDRLRHGAGPPLPDPVRRGRRRDRLPPRPRDRGRRPARDDGRRRREVRRLADDLGPLLGPGPLGRAVLRGARRQRRLADDDAAVATGPPSTARSAGSTSRPARTPRWASGPCRPTRASPSGRRSAGARAEHRPEARWLRGAIWRNFQVRYREINDIHKQMLATSAISSTRCPPARDRGTALDHLFAGQSNDCYWHGLFGGIYLPDLRVAALARLIAAEDLAAGDAARRPGSSATSTSTPATRSSSPARASSSRSSSRRAAGSPAGTCAPPPIRSRAVMRRRPEAYHETLRAPRDRRHGSADGARRRRPRAARPPRSTTSSWSSRRASSTICATTPTSAAPG